MSTRAFLDAYLSVTTLRPRNLYLAAFDALAAALDAATDTAQIGGHTFAAVKFAAVAAANGLDNRVFNAKVDALVRGGFVMRRARAYHTYYRIADLWEIPFPKGGRLLLDQYRADQDPGVLKELARIKDVSTQKSYAVAKWKQ